MQVPAFQYEKQELEVTDDSVPHEKLWILDKEIKRKLKEDWIILWKIDENWRRSKGKGKEHVYSNEKENEGKEEDSIANARK